MSPLLFVFGAYALAALVYMGYVAYQAFRPGGELGQRVREMVEHPEEQA